MGTPFPNEVVGGVTLIRPAIQSPNFIDNSTGWQVNADGSVEFNNGIFRGSLEAGSITNTPIGNCSVTGSSFQGGTVTETAITFDNSGGTVLIYATVVSSVTFTSGSGNWTAPAGITSVKGECWGGGGGGDNGIDGAGGGGGEYACEPALAVTPGNNYFYDIGTGGAGGAAAGGGTANYGGDGNQTVLNGDSVTVIAFGGFGGGSGGSGSANTIHFDGGQEGLIYGYPYNSPGIGGAGGGGGAGSNSSGGAGTDNSSNPLSNSGQAGGAGGTPDGGAGGAGGNATSAFASNGTAPGGGGGGGGYGLASNTNHAGGNGAAGQVRISWTTSKTLIGSIAAVAGTDSLGNSYPQGIAGVDEGGLVYGALGNASTYSESSLVWGAVGSAADTGFDRAGSGTVQCFGQVAATHPGTTATAETWQSVSLSGAPSGTSGYARVKLLPLSKFAVLDISITFTTLGSQSSFTIGSLPLASYYPPGQRNLPGGIGGTATGSPQQRVLIPTSGGIQLVDLPAGASRFDCCVMYPLD